MTIGELLELLRDPASRDSVQRALGIPSEATANALAALTREIGGLAAAQARTDASIEKLTAAQAQADERLTRVELAIDKLTAAQARTEAAIDKLTAAQARTEAAIDKLTAAQAHADERFARIDASLEKLAAAQARTEENLARTDAAVEKLATEIRGVRQELGRLSDNVGFGLEELAPIVLPGWLAREEGVNVELFSRRFLMLETGEEEIDLYAEARKNGSELVVVGECKSRIYTGDVKKFAGKVGRIAAALPPALPLMFGFVAHPAATEAGRALGVRIVATRPSV